MEILILSKENIDTLLEAKAALILWHFSS